MNEHEKFLNGLEENGTEVDILEAPLTPEPAKEETEEASTVDEPVTTTQEESTDDSIFGIKPKNRRERRKLQRLVEDRESAIDLANRYSTIADNSRAATEETDYIKSVESIYGSDTLEAKTATEILKKALVGVRDDAENRAYERIKAERQQEIEAESQAEQRLDSFIDEIEDTYNVALTEAQERSYFQLLQKMSPKDRNGVVIEYADPHAVWEVFQERTTRRPDNRAKDLSARSMVQSGTSKESNLQDDVTARALQDMGII